jgi:RNA polymerase sigma-70 factor (ECF subfamily)
VSNTFLVAWRKLDRIGPGAERAWLFAVARRETLQHVRRTARREALYERLLTHRPGATEDIADRVVARLVVWRALACLTAADRDVLLTTLWTDLTPTETAAVLSLSRATYAVKLHRARRRFARALAASTSEHEHLAEQGSMT